MKVFISHSYQDSALAKQLARGLSEQGFKPWLAENEVFPGDNWAEAQAAALKDSQAMIGLVTPLSGAAPQVRQELGYALTNKAYRGRVIPLIVGDRQNVPPNAFPWILERYRVVEIPSEAGMESAVSQIADELKRNTPAKAEA
jgi:signal recognition particle subunit SEC65